MLGYFIPENKAITLGLLDNSANSAEFQKVIIAITIKGIEEYINSNSFNIENIPDERINNISNWFYKNYYDAFMESLPNFIIIKK